MSTGLHTSEEQEWFQLKKKKLSREQKNTKNE